jgi:hypothetical protein
MRFRGLACLLGVAAGSMGVSGTAQADPPAVPDAGVVILMDRSGSMSKKISNCPNVSGEVYKWQCAAKKATDWITSNDTLYLNQQATIQGTYKYWFWQLRKFPDGTVVEKDPTPYSRQEMLTRLASYAGPTDDDASTPLAEVACDAIDMLRAETLPLRYLRVETDGLENASTDGHKCKGPHSTPIYQATPGELVHLTYSDAGNTIVATANNLTVPTWESNMLAMAVSGLLASPPAPTGFYTATQQQAYLPPSPNHPVIAQIDLFDDYVPPGAGGTLLRVISAPTSTVAAGGDGASMAAAPLALMSSVATSATLAAAASASNPNDPYAEFLAGLAAVTGGRMVRYREDGGGGSGTPTNPHAIPGDVNDSACVDGTDLSLLTGVFGQHVNEANPASYQADLTYDGVVDVRDYKAMLANWGAGCATPPAAGPMPPQIVLGFEDATKWSAAVAISNKLSPATGGTYSLYVGGTGWRALDSVKFASPLSGIQAKMAMDVYIPTAVSNRSWLGQVQLFVSIPSASINNLALGAVELTGKKLGEYSTIQFALPANVRTQLGKAHTDVSFRIALNANDPGYMFDSMRFAP